jgi:hypothetical protein
MMLARLARGSRDRKMNCASGNAASRNGNAQRVLRGLLEEPQRRGIDSLRAGGRATLRREFFVQLANGIGRRVLAFETIGVDAW